MINNNLYPSNDFMDFREPYGRVKCFAILYTILYRTLSVNLYTKFGR